MDLKDREQRIKIYLRIAGVEDVEKGFKIVKKRTDLLTASEEELKKKYGSVEKAIQQQTNAVGEQIRKSQKLKKEVKSLVSGFGALSGAAGEAGKGLMSLALPVSFGAAIKQTIDYNKVLLESSARVGRMGVGTVELENKLVSLSRQISLTRKATFELFQAYETEMRFPSLDDFIIMQNQIRNAVGSNEQAMQRMQTAIMGLSERYPVLGDAILNVNQSSREGLEERISNLFIIGKLNRQQYRSLLAYIGANAQATKGDRDRKKELDESVVAWQKFKKQVEEVGFAFANTIMQP